MTLPQKTATVFGGTGFIGRYVVRELARLGFTIKVATRIPEKAYFLRPYGVVGQIVPFLCNLKDQVSIDQAIAGSSVVVNCVGILNQTRHNRFQRIHIDAPAMIAASCAKSGVDRLIHISSLGVDKAGSHYAASKLAGERKVFEGFPNATILRPSVVFGPEDDFFNMIARMAMLLPVLPLIGGGRTKMQPVYVADIAAAIIAALTRHDTHGGVYELGGPEVLTLKEIYKHVFAWTGKSRLLISLPFPLAKIKAFFVQFIPPKPLLTPDQVESLKTDTVVSPYAMGLADLGIQPTGMELIVPGYLERFRAGGRFADIKTA